MTKHRQKPRLSHPEVIILIPVHHQPLFCFVPSSPREEPSQLITEQPTLLGSGCSKAKSDFASQSPPQTCKEPESQNKFLFVLAGSSRVPSLLATNQQTQFGFSLAVFPVVFGWKILIWWSQVVLWEAPACFLGPSLNF